VADGACGVRRAHWLGGRGPPYRAVAMVRSVGRPAAAGPNLAGMARPAHCCRWRLGYDVLLNRKAIEEI